MKSLADLLAPLSDPTDRLRLDAFGQTYATPEHLWLARCAAFPVALTTDLLYKIWLNFRQTDTGETVDIPINAVGDILLSPLCHEIGYDLYEMYPEARAVLWQSLSPDTVASLAEFTLRYLDFCRDKVPSEAFAEAQRISAEVILNPQKIAAFLGKLLSERKTNLGSKIMAEYVLSWVKNRNQWANQKGSVTTAQRDSLSDLAQIAEGIQQYEKGEITEAKATFSSIAHLLQAPRTGGFNVPIAKEIWQSLPINAPAEQPKGKIYAVLVGIDEYDDGLLNKQFNGCVNDVLSWQLLLKERFQSESTVSLTNSKATKRAIINALQDIFNKLQADDTLFFTFSGHAYNKELPHLLATYDTDAAQKGSYLSENEFRSLISQTGSQNPFVTVILDTHAGSSGWIDTNNEKHILLAATANGEISMEVDKKGLLTATLQSILDENKYYPITYQKLIRESFRKIKKANYKQTPQLFGHYNAITLTFLANSLFYDTYWHELLAVCGYSNSENKTIKVTAQDIADEFGPEMTVGNINSILEKYALLKGAEKLKVVRISSEMSVRQIPLFRREYLKSLPYEVEIKDISLFYAPSRAGLKDSMGYQEEIEDDLSSLQDAHIIVFVLNRALVNDFTRHTAIAPVINHLRRFEYKVVCSILWEDCDRGETALRDYPVFSLRQPLSQALFQKYNFAPEVEREIEEYYQDWQPVINKWITDLAALGFEKELKERIEKAKQTQELDLSGMGFEKLPEAVWELEVLKIIDLYNNKLSELPERLTQFRSLEKLFASKNPITSLPLFLSDLPNLRVLKIDDAQITEFPNWLCKHPALEDISLENNHIEIIPSALKELPKLRLFDFRGNPVINLPVLLFKAYKDNLKEYISTLLLTSFTETINMTDEAVLFLETNKTGEMNTISQLLGDTIDILNTSKNNYDAIYHLPSVTYRPLIVHIPQNNLSEEEIQKLSKLFLEYPTSTIFFLNFSNSKRLAELLYQQKHSPIIAFEGELDEETASNAVRYFYTEYQESKNAASAFQYMILKLPETSSQGLYTLYRY
ncbi:hypothetical protein DR864_08310 [Runella rosea]|uniref:Uncharacterized protein n=1 Tax=Runella rosea TaxID=2259595 RepID=A0A344TGG6_9BACT|nr:leucine-rich repeat domain-containing protein [Runella rosea]AXE17737.1 hypothetical protein DR864_08310 [Runella rosea]